MDSSRSASLPQQRHRPARLLAPAAPDLALIPRSAAQQGTTRIPGAEQLLVPFEKFTPHQLTSLAFDGVVKEILAGVYAPTSLTVTEEIRAAAAQCFMPSGTVLSRHTAAWVYGVLRHVSVVELAAEKRSRKQQHSTLHPPIIHECVFEANDVVRISTIPITSPHRTAIDLALWGNPHTAIRAIRLFAAKELIAVSALIETVQGFTRVPYQRRALELLELAHKNIVQTTQN